MVPAIVTILVLVFVGTIFVLNYRNEISTNNFSPVRRLSVKDPKTIVDKDATKRSATSSTVVRNTIYTKEWVLHRCNLSGVDWYPTGNDEWQQRMPSFLIAGVPKAGTTTLSAYLDQHPNIIKSRSGHKEVGSYFTGIEYDSEGRIIVEKKRKIMHDQEYQGDFLKQNDNFISYDGSPEHFKGISQRNGGIQDILCISPWVKLIVILRDPVERLFSEYKMHVRRGNQQVSFGEVIKTDIATMRKAGLFVNHKGNNPSFPDSIKEMQAWERYVEEADKLKVRGNPAPNMVGHGLYAIFLRRWIDALQSIGRDPKDAILLLRTEDVTMYPDEVYKQMIEFLQLPYDPLQSINFRSWNVDKNPTKGTMSKTTRSMLEKFYAPYNARLSDMLGIDWGHSWNANYASINEEKVEV